MTILIFRQIFLKKSITTLAIVCYLLINTKLFNSGISQIVAGFTVFPSFVLFIRCETVFNLISLSFAYCCCVAHKLRSICNIFLLLIAANIVTLHDTTKPYPSPTSISPRPCPQIPQAIN